MALIVISFDTPTGILVPAVQADDVFAAPFNVTAEFSATDGACGAGEYRQYVRGELRVDGRHFPKYLCGDHEVLPNTFREDGCPFPGPGPGSRPDILAAYGYRAFRDEQPLYRPIERYIPSDENGCSYEMTDAPGIKPYTPPPPRQVTYSVDLTFRGDLIESVTRQTLRSATWRVAGEITVPAPGAAKQRVVGFQASDRVIGVEARRDPATGTLDIYVDIARKSGQPPLDVQALGLVINDDRGRSIPIAGEPLAAEIVGRAGSRATLVYSLPKGSECPTKAEIRTNGAGTVHSVRLRQAPGA